MEEINKQNEKEKSDKEIKYRRIRSKRKKFLEVLNSKISSILYAKGIKFEITEIENRDPRIFNKSTLVVKVNGDKIYEKSDCNSVDLLLSADEILKHIVGRYDEMKDYRVIKEYEWLQIKLASKKLKDVLTRRSTKRLSEALEQRYSIIQEYSKLEEAYETLRKAIEKLDSPEIVEAKKKYKEMQKAELKAFKELMVEKGHIAKQNEKTK